MVNLRVVVSRQISAYTLNQLLPVKTGFGLSLTIAEDYIFTNNIKNPSIKAVINPRDALDGYIVLELMKFTNPGAPKITNLNPDYENNDGTLRHGATADAIDGFTQTVTSCSKFLISFSA